MFFPHFSTGFVPYIIAPRHFQENITSSSSLYHLWAYFLLCHRLSCSALYGPVSIPSVLYLAYLQLESHGFSPLTIIKSGEDKVIFQCPHLTKSRFPAGLFAASFQVFLTTCTIGRWKEVSTETVLNTSLWWTKSLNAEAYQIWGTRTRQSHGPKSCCAPTSRLTCGCGGLTNAADSQDYHYQKVKWNGLNQTGLFILSYILQINLINLYWILNLLGDTIRRAGTSSKMEERRDSNFQTFCCRLTIFK